VWLTPEMTLSSKSAIVATTVALRASAALKSLHPLEELSANVLLTAR
jgi:hypothetical protein